MTATYMRAKSDTQASSVAKASVTPPSLPNNKALAKSLAFPLHIFRRVVKFRMAMK
jgi:hypothetical protein